MKNIVCAHLLNDYSGSPLVLAGVARQLASQGNLVQVHTSGQNNGHLSNIPGVQLRLNHYRFFENKMLRLLSLVWSQVVLFTQMWRYRRSDAVFYINTLLPFGAAMAGRLLGKKVVYHLHETTVNPPIFKSFLKWIARKCASEVIYVSNFLNQAESLPEVPAHVIYNSLEEDFVKTATAYQCDHQVPGRPFTVLMLCSLKIYKGVDVFVRLAAALPEYRFLLVLNADMEQIRQYFSDEPLPENLIIFPAQKNVHSFYQQAHLVVNLSHPEHWVETFGLTLLEAMQYSRPVIAPPVGGPAELIEDGFNGFKIDQRNTDALITTIRSLATNHSLYDTMAKNAFAFSRRFDAEEQCRQIKAVLGS